MRSRVSLRCFLSVYGAVKACGCSKNASACAGRRRLCDIFLLRHGQINTRLALPPERSLPHASLGLRGIYAGSSVIRIRADSYRNRRLRTVPGSEPISKYPLHKRHTSARCTKETCLICIKKIFPAFRQWELNLYGLHKLCSSFV